MDFKLPATFLIAVLLAGCAATSNEGARARLNAGAGELKNQSRMSTLKDGTLAGNKLGNCSPSALSGTKPVISALCKANGSGI